MNCEGTGGGGEVCRGGGVEVGTAGGPVEVTVAVGELDAMVEAGRFWTALSSAVRIVSTSFTTRVRLACTCGTLVSNPTVATFLIFSARRAAVTFFCSSCSRCFCAASDFCLSTSMIASTKARSSGNSDSFIFVCHMGTCGLVWN